MAKKPGSPNQQEPFESQVERLEEIIDGIESGEYGLEESITAYEKGIAIIENCRGLLDVAEQRVDELNSRLANDDESIESGTEDS